MKKKSTKGIILSMVMVLFGGMGMAAFAQPGGPGGRPGPGERFDRMLNVLVDSVGIDGAQTEKVKVVNTKYQKIFEEARQQMQDGADREQMREKFRSTMLEYDKEISAILTKEQNVKYDKVKANRRARMQRERPNGPRPEGERGQRGPRGGN